MRWLVDGMNVIGSRPDGWWRDRDAAVRKLADRLARYRWASGDVVTVVFDGPRPADVGGEGVRVLFAGGGRDAADDEIVRILREDPDPRDIRVVTSDAGLAARVRATGADVTPSGAFLRALDAPAS